MMFLYLPNMIIEVISLVKGLFLQFIVNRPHQVTISTQVVPRDVVARASRDRAQTPLGRQLPRPPSPLHQLQPEPDQLQQDLHHLQPELGRRKREWELWSEELVSKQRGPGQGGLQPCSQVGTLNFLQLSLAQPNLFSKIDLNITKLDLADISFYHCSLFRSSRGFMHLRIQREACGTSYR